MKNEKPSDSSFYVFRKVSAYGTVKSIGHCLAAGGDFIIRIKNKAFNIYDAGGRKLVFADWLSTVGETAGELNAYVRNSEKKLLPLRICAV